MRRYTQKLQTSSRLFTAHEIDRVARNHRFREIRRDMRKRKRDSRVIHRRMRVIVAVQQRACSLGAVFVLGGYVEASGVVSRFLSLSIVAPNVTLRARDETYATRTDITHDREQLELREAPSRSFSTEGPVKNCAKIQPC